MSWILIIWLGSTGGMSSVASFYSAEACHAAAAAVDAQTSYQVNHVCVNSASGESE